MVFSSLEFLYLYLPVSLLIYFAVPAKHLKMRNLALLIMSLIFYGWSEPIYIFIMFYSIVLDYICGFFASKYRETDKKRRRQPLQSAV